MLLKIYYYFFVLPCSGGFRVSINQSNFRIHRVWLRVGLSPEPVFVAVSGFEFGFRVQVREGSTRSESASLPSLGLSDYGTSVMARTQVERLSEMKDGDEPALLHPAEHGLLYGF